MNFINYGVTCAQYPRLRRRFLNPIKLTFEVRQVVRDIEIIQYHFDTLINSELGHKNYIFENKNFPVFYLK